MMNDQEEIRGWALSLAQAGLDVAGQRALEAREPWRAKPVGFWDAVEIAVAKLATEPKPAFWAFDYSGDAYDACQCDHRIKVGDLLVIESEKVVGMADAWPVAISAAAGKFHVAKDAGYFISMDGMGASAAQLAAAIAECKKRGWPLHAIFSSEG